MPRRSPPSGVVAEARQFYDGDLPWCTGCTYAPNSLKRLGLEGYLAKLPPDGVAAELACGPGTYLPTLQDHARAVVGVDLSRRSLKRAMAIPGALLVQGDALRLPIRSRSVDVVTMVDALEHLPLGLALDEVRRILRPGGAFIAIGYAETNPWSLPWVLRVLGTSWEELTGDHLGHINPFSPRQLRRELRARGFTVEAMAYTSHLPRQVRSLFPHLLKRLRGVRDPGGMATVTALRHHRWFNTPSALIDALEARSTAIAFTAEEVMVHARIQGD